VLITGGRKSLSSVFIIVPTYNEAENLPRLIKALNEELKETLYSLIVVDDNSPDGTSDIAENLSEYYKNIIVNCRSQKLGIGSAISDGITIALSFPNCKYIVTMDADFSHNPKDVPRLLKEGKNADIIQGSRYIKGGKIIGWSLLRKAESQGANLICKLLFRTRLSDHTSFFRVYSKKCAETIVNNSSYMGFEWSIGSILIAKDHGFKIIEIPVTFTDRTQGKSKLKLQDILQWSINVTNMFFKRLF
jgi:dolichol-phosphate mannosyltransferase